MKDTPSTSLSAYFSQRPPNVNNHNNNKPNNSPFLQHNHTSMNMKISNANKMKIIFPTFQDKKSPSSGIPALDGKTNKHQAVLNMSGDNTRQGQVVRCSAHSATLSNNEPFVYLSAEL